MDTQSTIDPKRFDEGMWVVITGSGSAMPDPERGNASQAVIVDGRVFQFDCGRGVLENLLRVGINPLRIETLVITHLHLDHIANYGYLIMTLSLGGRPGTLRVVGPRGTAAMSDASINGVHEVDTTLMREVADAWPPDMPGRPRREHDVEVKDVVAGVVFEDETVRITAFDTDHFDPVWGQHSLGFRVDSRHGSVAISGDSGPCDSLVAAATGVDILVHECVLPELGATKGGKFAAPLDQGRPYTRHTRPSELAVVGQRVGATTVVATHLGPYTSAPAAVELSAPWYGHVDDGVAFWSGFRASLQKGYDGEVLLAEDGLVLQVNGDSENA